MASDDELRGAMATTMRGFASVVASIKPQQLNQPTPCTEWSVFEVIDHVVAGERFTAMTLGGASLAEAIEAQVGIDPKNPDLVAQVTDAAGEVLVAFEGSLDRIIEHRVGPVLARRVLGFRIIDQLGHTWDLATATGRPAELDPNVLAIAADIVLAERTTLEQSPNFATLPDEPGATLDPQAAFLRAIGRTP